MRTAVLVALVCALAHGPATAQTLPDWMNAQVDEAVAARLAQRGSGRQLQAPSIARGSTSIVEHASFADLVGLALDILPATDGGASGPGATAITLTPYTVLSALQGANPDDPFEYMRESAWRSLALTLGTEPADSTTGQPRAALVGLKILLWNKQSVDPSSPWVSTLRTRLGAAGAAFGGLTREIQDSLYAWVGAQIGLDKVAFINRIYNDSASLPVYLNLAGSKREATLRKMIANKVDTFVSVREAADSVVTALRGAPLLSFNVQSRLPDGRADEVRLGLDLDLGLTSRAHWTVNGAATVQGGSGGAPSAWGSTVASGLKLSLGSAHLTGPDPLALVFAFEGQFMEGQTATWRLQGKLDVPVLEGLSLPVSVTWASRTDLLDESRVVGRVGFTVDTSRLLSAVRGR